MDKVNKSSLEMINVCKPNKNISQITAMPISKHM